MDEVALLPSRMICNLGDFWDSQLLLHKQVSASSKENLCTTPSGVPAVLFPRSGITHALVSSGFDNSMCFTWGYLEDHPKTSTVLEYSDTKSNGHASVCPCNTSVLQAAPLVGFLLAAI